MRHELLDVVRLCVQIELATVEIEETLVRLEGPDRPETHQSLAEGVINRGAGHTLEPLQRDKGIAEVHLDEGKQNGQNEKHQ